MASERIFSMKTIKTEPEEYIDDDEMNEAAERLINMRQVDQLVVDPDELGVLGSMMKAYQLNGELSGPIEFLLKDSNESFVISVKRVEDMKQSTSSATENKRVIGKASSTNVHHDSDSKDNIMEDINGIHNYFKSGDSKENEDIQADEEEFEIDADYIVDAPLIEEIIDDDDITITIDGDSEFLLPTDEMQENMADVEKIYTCSHCHFTTPLKDQLLTHLLDHSKDLLSPEGELIEEEYTKEESPPSPESDTAKKKNIKTETKKRRGAKSRLSSKRNAWKIENNYDNSDVKEELDPLMKRIKSEVYQCSLCDFTSLDQTKFYRHIGLVHTNDGSDSTAAAADTAMTQCELCPYKGKDRRRLVRHMKTTHGQGPKHTCQHCSYSTTHLPNFQRHVQTVHDKLKPVKCDQCSFVTTRNYLLQKHIMYKHHGIKPYQCTECEFGSTSSSRCKAHIMEVHRGERPYKCIEDNCNFATSRRFVLMNHVRSVHMKDITGKKDLSFACAYCDHVASQKGNLARHIKVRHSNERERYKCGECDFTSSQKYYVETHITEVHRGEYPYSCNLCEFKSSMKQRYERHFQAVHLGQKPYQCELCGYKSSQKVHMDRHIEVIHRGEKPHVCVYCQFHTGHRGNLKAHLKAIHKVAPELLTDVLNKCTDLRKQNTVIIVSQSPERRLPLVIQTDDEDQQDVVQHLTLEQHQEHLEQNVEQDSLEQQRVS